MLYFFYGDSKKASDKANELIKKMLEKKPDASVFVIDDENCREGILQEMTRSRALFQNRYIVKVKRIENSEKREVIFKFLKEIKESENVFVWSEGKVSILSLNKIKKFAEKSVEVGKSQIPNSKSQNKIFEICNSIINRNKKDLWSKYRELLEIFAPEEIHGTIFWQFKNIAIVSKSSQKESGLAPFPYQNAKKGLNKYSEKEILEKVSELSRILHESRSGEGELEILLEKFILNL